MAKLFRAGLVTASATFLSRILGLIRDIFIANLLGAGLSADVFFFANRIPNFLRRLFAEGAFSQAFVPVMTEFKEQGDKKALNGLIAETTGTLGAVVFLVTIIGMLGSAVITAIFGWGWFMAYLNDEPDGSKFLQASVLLKITFPYLFFITLTAVSGAILNTLGRFAVPAITPCLLNVAMIGVCVFLAPHMDDANEALAFGMLIGGIIQLLFQMPFLYKLGCLVRPKFAWNSDGVSRIRKLMIPALFGVSVSQINLLINTVLASFLATGAISYLYYSDRLLEFPIGIFAVAIGTVILPALSRVKVNNDKQAFAATMDWGVRTVLSLGIPAMCGEYDVSAAMHSSMSLVASVSGLWAIMLVRVLVPGFNACLDTKTPVRYGMMAIGANILFNLVMVYPLERFYGLGFVGLALSTALAALVNVSLLLRGLHTRGIYSVTRKTIIFIGKIIVGAGLMWGALYFAMAYIAKDMTAWAQINTWQAILYLVLLVSGGALVYGIVMVTLGVRPRDYRG